ncbi:thiamine diphosphokinase [Mycoplasmatota bacterium zrk1]
MIVRIIAGAPSVYLDDFSNDYVIAVDFGVEHAVDNNIKIDLAVGDFDSVDKKLLIGLKTLDLNPVKDETDLYVAVLEAIKLKPDKIYIYGATNGRFDHYYANINLLDLYNIEIVDEINRIYIMADSAVVKKKNEYVSFFHYSGNPVISLLGFKYELRDYKLEFRDNLCVSNEVMEEKGIVKVTNGKILVVHSIK